MNSPLKLVVGLGNPGRAYQRTRHNAGFWWIDALADTLRGQFVRETKFSSAIAKLEHCWLLKPQTYMNLSGKAVASFAHYYQIPSSEILVAYDELDLKPGSIKLKWAGGHAGHNGIKDIQAQLASADFWRLRIGIGHPRDQTQEEVADYVLHPPRAAELDLIEAAMAKALAVWPMLRSGDMERAMHLLHTKAET